MQRHFIQYYGHEKYICSLVAYPPKTLSLHCSVGGTIIYFIFYFYIQLQTCPHKIAKIND